MSLLRLPAFHIMFDEFYRVKPTGFLFTNQLITIKYEPFFPGYLIPLHDFTVLICKAFNFLDAITYTM